MSETRKGVRYVTWLLVATVGILWAADASARGGLEQYLPEDTLVYISANDLSSYRLAFEGTALYDIGQEPSVRRAIDQLRELGRQRVEEEFGLSLDKIGNIFSGQVIVALTQLDIEKEKVGAILVADIESGKAASLKELLSAIEVRLRGSVPLEKQQTFTYNETEITLYEVDELTICYCFPRDRFALSIGTAGRETMESFLDNLANSPRASLADDPEFRNIFARIGQGSHSFSFFNVGKLLDLLAQAAEDEDVPKLMEALGLRSVKAVGATSTIVGKGFKDVTYIHAPGERRGLMKLLGTQSNVLEMLRYFPENVSSVSAFTIDFPGLWQEFLSVMRQLEPDEAEDMAEGIAEFEGQLGLSV
ncbi:MAG: DUF3352 domain-containing protein, partial [Candidatus Hydrogenedentes bacterium]|nr:DUF3352 domain-containing protein [Candidatus Hydrogenedentota bacterium]